MQKGRAIISTFHKRVSENGEITQETTPAPNTGVSKKSDGSEISQFVNPFNESSSEDEGQKILKSSNNGVGNHSLERSAPEEVIYSSPWDSNRALGKLLSDEFGDPGFSTPFTPKDDSDIENNKADSITPLINSGKKTNRIWPRVKYTLRQRRFIISSTSAIILGISTALVYMQDKAKFIVFFTNSQKYITIPVIVFASLLAIIPIFCAIKQFRNTEECQLQTKSSDEILAGLLKYQPEDKAIKSVRLEYSNGTHSNFTLNAWEAKKDFINIDEKVISRVSKVESVINDRPLFTALLTGVVATNIVLPLGLLAIDGINSIQKFYQNPLNHRMELSFLIGLGVFVLLIICLGVHYYNKVNCTNLIYSQEKIDPRKVSEKFIRKVKQERVKVLGEIHSKEAKCSSLALEQIVVQSHNYPDTIYSINK